MYESGSCFDNGKLRAVSTTFWAFSSLDISTGSHAELVGCRFLKPVNPVEPDDDARASLGARQKMKEEAAIDRIGNIGLIVEGGSEAIVKESTFEGLSCAIYIKGLRSSVTVEGNAGVGDILR